MKALNFTFLKLIILCICFSSCNNKEKQINIPQGNIIEKNIEISILNGFYTQINNDISFSIYQDNLYCFNISKDGFSKNKFLLHLIDKNNSFKNLDFYKSGNEINDSLKGVFKDISIIHKKIDLNYDEKLRIGQFRRNDDGTTDNLWVKESFIDDIFDRKETYKNQLQSIIEVNLLNVDFEKALKSGVFFKINHDFYILLYNSEGYVISTKPNDIENKFMLHLIKENNEFDNLSFYFKNNNYQQFLDLPYNKFKISKFYIPQEHIYWRLRVGQFNSNGNIWVQEIDLNDVYSNDLLKYDGEFNLSPIL